MSSINVSNIENVVSPSLEFPSKIVTKEKMWLTRFLGQIPKLHNTYDLRETFIPDTTGSIRYVHPEMRTVDMDKAMFVELERPAVRFMNETDIDRTHVCLACLEIGLAFPEFSSDPSIRRQHLKFHANQEIQFRRIEELSGVILRVYSEFDPLPDDIPREPTLTIKHTERAIKTNISPDPSLKRRYEDAMVRLSVANNLPMEMFSSPAFKELIDCVRAMGEEGNMTTELDRTAKDSKINELYHRHWDEFRLLVESDKAISYSIVMNKWDWQISREFIGVAAVVLCQNGSRLSQETYPLFFRMDSSSDITQKFDDQFPIKLIRNEFIFEQETLRLLVNDMKIPLNKFMGVTANAGSVNAQHLTDALNADFKNTALNRVYAKVKNVMLKEKLKLCESDMLSKSIEFAAEHVLFHSSPPLNPPPKAVIDQMANPPSSSLELHSLLNSIRASVKRLGRIDTWQKIREAAIPVLKVDDLPPIEVDVNTRWTTFVDMLYNLSVIEPFYRSLVEEEKLKNSQEDGENSQNQSSCFPHISDEQFSVAKEIYGILKPLRELFDFLTLADFPTTSMTLPLIFTVLLEYGIKPDRCDILGREACTEEAFRDVKFDVPYLRDLDKPMGLCLRSVCEMHPRSREFFACLRINLLSHLVIKRKNMNLIELLGCYCDPIGVLVFPKLFCETKAEYECALMKLCAKQLSKTYSSSLSTQQTTVMPRREDCKVASWIITFDLETVPPSDALDRELQDFVVDCKKSLGYVLRKNTLNLTIEEVLACYAKLSPFDFWSSTRKVKYPCLYELACIFLGFTNHSRMYTLPSPFGDDHNSSSGFSDFVRTYPPDLVEKQLVLHYKYRLDELRSQPLVRAKQTMMERDDKVPPKVRQSARDLPNNNKKQKLV